MTNQEFSDAFDLLFNNIASNQAPGLDDYEKSFFLTKAQDEIIKSYFNPAYNKSQEGFDGNERRLIDFSMLITVAKPTINTTANFDTHNNSFSVNMPKDIMMIVNEQVQVARGILLVIPISYTEYTRLMSKPYKRPLRNQAWRISNSSGITNSADIVIGCSDTKPNAETTPYTVRYVRRPLPIILFDLEDVSLSDGPTWEMQKASTLGNFDTSTRYYKLINGNYVYVNNPSSTEFNTYYIRKDITSKGTGTKALECELDPILHQEILLRAVELAKAVYAGDLTSLIALGQTSATEKGVVARQ